MTPEQQDTEKTLFLLAHLHKDPKLTQRELASRLNISLGKANYLLKALIKRGWVKVKQFSSSPGKLKKVKYNLTAQGIEQKINLAYQFLKRKEAEYENIKKGWDDLIGSPK